MLFNSAIFWYALFRLIQYICKTKSIATKNVLKQFSKSRKEKRKSYWLSIQFKLAISPLISLNFNYFCTGLIVASQVKKV